MKYYSVIKRDEVLTHITTWMNLENTMLSERSQSRKPTYYMIPLYEMSRTGKSNKLETKNKLVIA